MAQQRHHWQVDELGAFVKGQVLVLLHVGGKGQLFLRLISCRTFSVTQTI